MKKLYVFLELFFFCSVIINAQSSKVKRIDPPSWWVGMKNPSVQLMVYGDNISRNNVKINYSGVKITNIHKVENPNYLFIDLKIDISAFPGTMKIQLNDTCLNYKLSSRNKSPNRNQGISSKDLIYLIMPDRFANGDYGNDNVVGMNEDSMNRDSMYYRHGGDIQGIIDHLDYIKDIGMTTIWCTPEIENNQFVTSYHGYSATDHYKIDPRLGSNDLYKKFVAECHRREMKVIKDLVHNHVGSEYWILKDLPMKDWIHDWDVYTTSTYNCEPVIDPYSSEKDRTKTLNGWLHTSMPDLNEENPFVQKYLTQNSIWWLEFAGVDAIRLDTYFYNNQDYMIDWATKVKSEFPDVTIFAETWVKGISNQAFFNGGNTVSRGIDSKIDGITDFQFRESLLKMINQEPTEWKNKLTPNISMNPVYSTLACDFIYKNPANNIAFLDNHDLSRIFSVLDKNINKLKTAITVLLTTNRIPQLYYGTEIGITGLCNPDGLVRKDFPGGWYGDKKNKFLKTDRNEVENELYNYIRKLANYRRNSTVLQTGKMMQYFPSDNIYVYFRYNENETVMIVVNPNAYEVELNANDYDERTSGFSKAINIITEQEFSNISKLHISAKEAVIFELYY